MTEGSKIFRRSFDEVYNASVRVLGDCGFSIKEKTNNTIKASSDISIFSWGEDIEVRLTSKPNGIEVKITSEARQIFDWGKSQENVSIFLSKLVKQLGE